MKKILKVEIASTPEQHTVGLMGRKAMPFGEGMLFDFGSARPLSFWMANTYIPLQVAFIDDAGAITQIERGVPLSTRAIRSKKNCRFALEVNEGWFDENNLGVGSFVEFPPLSMTRAGQVLNAQPQAGTQPPAPVQPEAPASGATLVHTDKAILKAMGMKSLPVLLEYYTKSGVFQESERFDPPFNFVKSEDGDAEGVLVAFSAKDGDWRSVIVENIKCIKDVNQNLITNLQQVEAIGKKTPLTEEEALSLKGKGFSAVE